MDIPLVNTAPARAPGIVTPITPTQVQATVQAQSAALLVAQTTVDLSPLGRFLSAVALFQKRMLELQSNPAAVAAEQASEEESISPLALAVADLAASANALQASSITGTSDDQSLATLFGQQMAAQAGLEDDTDDAGLSAIGLTFGSASGLDDGDVLNVDTAVLQAAFATDPVATTALLSRTATAFGALAGIAPAESAGADPAVVFTDEAGPFALQPQPTQQQAAQPPEAGQSRGATDFSSDAAFFQELLADTSRPTLALEQAAPPEVAEAIANFEAGRVTDSGQAQAQMQSAPDPSAVPVQPEQQSSLSVQTAAAQPARAQANQTLEAQDAARDANERIGDTIAAERAANERIANTMAAERAMLATGRDAQSIDEAALTRAGEESVEQQRLARDADLTRLDRAREARAFDMAELEPSLRRDTIGTVTAARTTPAVERADVTVSPPRPVNNAQPLINAQQLNSQQLSAQQLSAQQLARDPAIAAAIAAYNLSAGPFAALNGRPEQAALRPKVVAPVDSVTKVAAIETDASTSESSGRSGSAPGQLGGRA